MKKFLSAKKRMSHGHLDFRQVMEVLTFGIIGRRNMQHIQKPTVIRAAGSPPKLIEEFIGKVNSRTSEVSIARMTSPAGWSEPGQKPAFNEYTVVLRGTLRVRLKDRELDVAAGQAIVGEWVQYGTPNAGGAEYIAVCLPAFSPEAVHRDT
jgi:mannose-6-phosphate isomerase-like protein (cupin superfamily)